LDEGALDLIIAHKHKLVFVTTPKSGSLTGFTLMREYFGGKEAFNHKKDVPVGVRGYHIFTFVRNPYERFCALWHSCVELGQTAYLDVIPKYAQANIVEYAKWCISLTDKTTPPSSISGLYTSQSYWHKTTWVKEFIHIEEAAKVFQLKYPELDIEFPHSRKRKHARWDELRTDELTMLINKWAGKDFERFGYEKELNLSS